MKPRAVKTLCIDVGGSGIKAIVLDATGKALTERMRIETPQPATPEACLLVIAQLAAAQGAFDRVSVGFPGVVVDGVTRSAPNLSPEWAGFGLTAAIETMTSKPARAANDAGVQGLGVIEGKGVEAVITLGTGMGFGLYVDGRYVPNIELAHHPFRKNKTYEERVGHAALLSVGKKAWNKRVSEVFTQLEPILNYRVLYVGGGNSRLVKPETLPDNVRIVDNLAGLLGGIRLWA
ncbi:MAG: ROK family protein [Myxococcales bacterium]|nr:ROK family protein [Myxococcales bacterium]